MSTEKPPTPTDQSGEFAATPADSAPSRPPRPCPNCGKMSVAASYPFCSKRCRMVDLNRWLTGAYAIPVKPEEEDDDEA
jgi:endogenous inhibitor of DNA gyrase (YacG/DUF329 family)